MMTFKEFYLQSSKRTKAPPREPRSFKTPKRQNEILERIAKRKTVKYGSGVDDEHFQMRKRMSGIFYYDHFNGGGSSLRSSVSLQKYLKVPCGWAVV